MQLRNTFTVTAPVDALWDVLNDVERFAPYIPGFVLTEADGDRYRGRMKIKVGAVTVQYDVDITVVERDAVARTVKAVAAGRERRGAGTMRADVTGSLAARGGVTEATITTDLDVTGRVAQFGRNILAEVAGRLLTKFADDLEKKVLADPGPEPAAPNQSQSQSATVGTEPVDLVEVAGASVAKRFVPAGLALVMAVALYRIFRGGR
ncbi:SRPBCC family protein [Pseudonocardia bannensis]|uniref:SRPBCC family protein n=1 Tax=Pseudonocardia bannensis TaxID=630973 RepID=A0A848DH69_9PSEU|nr:SRPBCC family protein [Pseudonocardia bannensis]NMH92022.1 SRPBCC family protein [Pseudonocardia bannensis]